MSPQQYIEAWLWKNQHDTFLIARRAVIPLLLDADGAWIGDADFPSGADYIDKMVDVIDACGLCEHISKLQ